MKRFLSTFTLIFLLSLSSAFAQVNVNSYKYVIVPDQYEFQKSADQYQINSLTKFLFEKYGFTVLSSSENYPADLALNPCLAIKGMVKNKSGMLTIKAAIELVDCYNKPVFTSSEGKSKSKEYKKGYHEAIRMAFADIASLNYKYDGSSNNVIKQPTTVAINKEDLTPNKVVEPKPKAVNKEVNPVVPSAVVAEEITVAKKVEESPKQIKKYSIEGKYDIDMWGTCEISKKGEGYKVVGGDNFEFATITKTSVPNLFMVKKTGFKEPKLLELDANGNLKIDSKEGFKIYKRVN